MSVYKGLVASAVTLHGIHVPSRRSMTIYSKQQRELWNLNTHDGERQPRPRAGDPRPWPRPWNTKSQSNDHKQTR